MWVTHNFMGWFDGFDHYVLAKDLDMTSWDWYVGSCPWTYLRDEGLEFKHTDRVTGTSS